MAEQMQSIKRRIKSIASTERITNAMKLVSAAKLRRAKAVYERSEEFLRRITESMNETFDNASGVPKDFLLNNREIKTTCYVIITSSTGLCGSFNGNVIRATETAIKNSKNNVKLVTIGTKGKEHFVRQNIEVLMTHDTPADTVTFEETKEISDTLIEKYRSGEIDEIVLIFTSYINTLKQEVVEQRILPIDMSQHVTEHSEKSNVVEYAPSPEEVFGYLVPEYFSLKLYGATIESATCEHAARRSAMENANDNASDMLNDLQVSYNRARQAQITNAIIEIVSGAEAQK